MNVHLTIDKTGRVAIQLEPGDTLELEGAGDQITLRPVRGSRLLTKEQGVWVFRTGHPISASVTDDVLRQIRQDRDLENLGSGE